MQHQLHVLSMYMVSMVSLTKDFKMSDPVISSQKTVKHITDFTPDGCGDSDYCEDTPDYPDEEIIRDIVVNLGRDNIVTQMFFNKSSVKNLTAVRDRILTEDDIAVIAESDFYDDPRTSSMSARGYSVTTDFEIVTETPLCHAIESFVFPKSARTRSDQWRFVINLPSQDKEENYVQAVRVEKCLAPEEPCNLATCDHTTTVCRQKYEFTKLLALREDGEQYVDEFRFPSGCVCYSKKNFPFELSWQQEDSTAYIPKQDLGGIFRKTSNVEKKRKRKNWNRK